MAKIIKTIITLTLLHREDFPLSQMSLEQIGHEMDEGDCVGSFGTVSEEAVPLAKVPAELEALGNDGTFFDLEDGDYTDS